MFQTLGGGGNYINTTLKLYIMPIQSSKIIIQVLIPAGEEKFIQVSKKIPDASSHIETKEVIITNCCGETILPYAVRAKTP